MCSAFLRQKKIIVPVHIVQFIPQIRVHYYAVYAQSAVGVIIHLDNGGKFLLAVLHAKCAGKGFMEFP
jgi:hypothetical protein